jgi:hypothetical protein
MSASIGARVVARRPHLLIVHTVLFADRIYVIHGRGVAVETERSDTETH